MPEYGFSNELNPQLRRPGALTGERERLSLDLQHRLTRLNEQARIFIPLIALSLIVAMPVWSKSPVRFLLMLLSPFVLFPLGFCAIHLAVAWRGIARAKSRIREWDRVTAERNGLES
jgi:hypothetical protein